MSKINAVRLININYNHNAIRISDETFHFNGESTLMSLRNGGGKSVLVQMMMAPFVHRRYRDAKDRAFESYFTTSKPSFIMTEWALDRKAGYVLAGMMVRKAQDSEENEKESLEIINFISEYPSACLHDIHRIPVVEKGKREIILKNYGACRQLFEEYKRDPAMRFFYYEMSNSAQSRQYFEKLQEYQINYKEWEGIIKKVNLKESGLSDLFADCRDEKGLVEKWLLDAVENKLNKDKNHMKEFQVILEKYVGQYKDNQSKIKRRDVIRLFQQEAAGIEERNQQYLQAGQELRAQENRIGCFLKELQVLHKKASQEEQENQQQTEAIGRELAQLEYEKLSQEYYQLEEKKRFHISNREMIAMEQEGLEREAEKLQQNLYLLACARQQEIVTQEQEEWELAHQRLSVARERDKDLEPERNGLGFLLRACSVQALEETNDCLKSNAKESATTAEEMKREQEAQQELEQILLDNALALGEHKSKMESYDRQEEQFHVRYQERLVRNMLGEYQPGSLEVFAEVCKKTLSDTVRKKKTANQELEQEKNRKAILERKIASLREERTLALAKQEQRQQLQEDYEQELSQRRAILKYLQLEESALLWEEKIFQAADRKLNEIETACRSLEKEENQLQGEYQRLAEGRVLELPPKLLEEFESLGIHTVYGMEWLEKNGYSEKKNLELVRKNPFLPYALILSEKEVEKLSHITGTVPMAFPIPIILRKELEQKISPKEGNVIQFPNLRFYLLFQDELLDQQKRKELVAQKQRQIQQKQQMIAVRRQEYQQYFAWKEQVKNQKVRSERYQDNQAHLENLSQDIKALDHEIPCAAKELSLCQERRRALEQEIRRIDQEIEMQKRKEADFQELFRAYQEYQENRRNYQKCQKKEMHLIEKQKLSRLKMQKLQEKQQSLQNTRAMLERSRERRQEQFAQYQGYKKAARHEVAAALQAICFDQGPVQASDLSGRIGDFQEKLPQMEARFAAVTARVSLKIQELELQEQHSRKRYRKAKEELTHLAKKHRQKEHQWQKVAYSRRQENDLEIRLEDRRMKIKLKESLWNQEDKQAALFEQQMQDRVRRMANEYFKEAPLSKEEIPKEDFETRKAQLDYQRKELQKTGKELSLRLQSYDENLTALAEYGEFPAKGPSDWERDISSMDVQTLRNFKGILLRDYNRLCGDQRDARERLVHLLNQVARKDCFQEDFYRKPLEAMLELSADAVLIQRQLITTLQSYRSLMEKLEVDISMVEKEKSKIVELLEEYLLQVHRNLGNIDQNSTITIRERPVKMLKIQLPSWEENEGMYHVRLEDFMDQLTRKGIAIFEQNENAQEYFGTQMTTRNLYDTVVGIGNVQIRLYKIEEQREYPITWAEVARNSGGEGFLSAFVVLSSLLYFMRRDDSDIFADRNEGKVLLMDNPFAQTNAAHLLKPLMDMAKKTNTQLICFTGLGGESIYSRFDNIYVLNLIAASLRQGMQYLKAEHMRGSEPETIVATQIEVVEQQELVF